MDGLTVPPQREFPVHAGMNRVAAGRTARTSAGVPRTRGDEPRQLEIAETIAYEFPVHAGMNRIDQPDAPAGSRVPRTRGDEPRGDVRTIDGPVSSPYTRG